jgi:hypothetical protein
VQAPGVAAEELVRTGEEVEVQRAGVVPPKAGVGAEQPGSLARLAGGEFDQRAIPGEVDGNRRLGGQATEGEDEGRGDADQG